MSYAVDFQTVSIVGLESSPVATASKLAGTIRGSFFVIKGQY